MNKCDAKTAFDRINSGQAKLVDIRDFLEINYKFMVDSVVIPYIKIDEDTFEMTPNEDFLREVVETAKKWSTEGVTEVITTCESGRRTQECYPALEKLLGDIKLTFIEGGSKAIFEEFHS